MCLCSTMYQSLQLTEIQTHYDEVQRQLQVTLDQYGVAQRRIQSLTGEVEEIRGNYEQVSINIIEIINSCYPQYRASFLK